MTTPLKYLVLAASIYGFLAKGAVADVMTEKDAGAALANARLRSCGKEVFTHVGNREFRELSEKLSGSIDDVHESLEEWGTLTLSGLLLAPPIKPGGGPGPRDKVGTFGIDINGAKPGAVSKEFNFDKWFTEAGKGEGTAQFTERLFNSLVASGTLQLAPEQAAIADSFLQRQKVNQQLFQEQLERSRIQRQAEQEDATVTRKDRQRARELRIEAADSAASRATMARTEADVMLTETNRKEKQAEEALAIAEKNLTAAPADQVETLTRVRDDRKADLARAQAQQDAAAKNQTARVGEEKSAIDARSRVRELPLNLGTPDATIPEQKDSPTLEANAKGASGFNFASESMPGSTLTTFSSQSFTGFPTATPTDLATVFPQTGQTISTLGNESEATFPARARLIDAAGNQTIARIFDFLGNPAAALEFTDKPIIMAAGTIAVNPGWRTTHDYDGQIDCSAVYKWGPARRVTCERIKRAGELFNPSEIEVAEHFWHVGQWPKAQSTFQYTQKMECLENSLETPLAAAVSPLMERQNLDQSSSRARQDEIALFLSASLAKSGQKGAADVFDKYIRLRRLDVKTRSALPVVNSYGLGGNHFGFNVTSRIQAIAEINKGRAGGVLEKQNFPVLVVFGLSSEDLRPRLVKNAKTGAAEIWEPQIHLAQTHRWMRQKKIGAFHQVVRSVTLPGFPGRPMESPSEAHRVMINANYWWERMHQFLNHHPELENDLVVRNYVNVAEEDYDFLTEASFLAETNLDVPVEYLVGPLPAPPAPSDPTIFTMLPNDLLLRAVPEGGFSGEVVLMGENLQLVDTKNIRTLPEGGTVDGKVWGPQSSQGHALKLRVKFAAAPPDRFQFQLPAGPAVPPATEPPYLYSPMIVPVTFPR